MSMLTVFIIIHKHSTGTHIKGPYYYLTCTWYPTSTTISAAQWRLTDCQLHNVLFQTRCSFWQVYDCLKPEKWQYMIQENIKTCPNSVCITFCLIRRFHLIDFKMPPDVALFLGGTIIEKRNVDYTLNLQYNTILIQYWKVPIKNN